MTDIQKRVDTILEATKNWLSDDNLFLKDAIDQTVREGYFSFEDVTYAIEAIKKSISRTEIAKWIKRVELNAGQDDASAKRVLCLHAGNLPLVGFHDALATLLSGARYTGKISRKDPYLLPTFLNEIKKTNEWSDMDVQWTHRLDDFEGMLHDAVLFSGSESSVTGVRQAIARFNLAAKEACYLIRTAHFSMAYIKEMDKEVMSQLAQAILRYGGKGCRSVAMVVAPYALQEVKNDLASHMKDFWTKNPQHELPPPRLRHQFAYNEAIERSQLWLNYFLVQEGGIEFDQDFICYWVQGDEEKIAELARNYQDQLQSIYLSEEVCSIDGWEERTELLKNSQQPRIDWQPDGVDTLAWLTDLD